MGSWNTTTGALTKLTTSLQEKPQEKGCRELRQKANLLLCLCMFLVATWDDGLLSPRRPIILYESQVDMLSIQKGSIIYFLQRFGHDRRGQWHVFINVKWKAPLYFLMYNILEENMPFQLLFILLQGKIHSPISCFCWGCELEVRATMLALSSLLI